MFKSLFKWVQVFGPAFILLEIIAAAGVALTGNWNLLWLIPYIVVLFAAFILVRLVIITFLIAFLWLFPLWVAIIVVWVAFILFKGKRQKGADHEIPAGNDTTTSGPAS